jgi:hypothetical protein
MQIAGRGPTSFQWHRVKPQTGESQANQGNGTREKQA